MSEPMSPNIEALLHGYVSGKFYEWPLLRGEVAALIKERDNWKRTYDLTLTNEIRWMRKYEEAQAELERLRAERRATLILPSEVGSDGKCPGCAKHIEDTNPTHIIGCSVFARRAEQRIPPFVYYVGGVSREPLRHCVWGYFHDEQRALWAAHNNETDINEAGYYPFALVAKVREGMVELPEAQWWFEFDGTHYNRIETPEWTRRYGWLGFPTAATLKRPRGLPESACSHVLLKAHQATPGGRALYYSCTSCNVRIDTPEGQTKKS